MHRNLYATHTDYFSCDKALQGCREAFLFKALFPQNRRPRTTVFRVFFYADAITTRSHVMQMYTLACSQTHLKCSTLSFHFICAQYVKRDL